MRATRRTSVFGVGWVAALLNSSSPIRAHFTAMYVVIGCLYWKSGWTIYSDMIDRIFVVG